MGRTPLGLTVRSTTIGQQESCDSQPAQLSQPILDELFFGMAHHRHGDADKQQVESLKASVLCAFLYSPDNDCVMSSCVLVFFVEI